MAGIALFLPNDELYNIAVEVLEEIEHDVILVKKINTENVVKNTLEAIELGVNIIVARGRHASEIKKHTNAVVQEICVTAQELGLLIIKAKKLCKKEKPKIVVFGWENMICDTTYFNELFDIELHKCILNIEDNWQNDINSILSSDIDVVIGGTDIIEQAKTMRIPTVFLSATKESLMIALNNAQNLYKIYQSKEYNIAQLNSLLQSAFNGIMKISKDGEIQVVNHVLKAILNINDNVIGKNYATVLKGINNNEVEKVISGHIENYSTFLKLNNNELVLFVEPIIVEDEVTELIISCNIVHNVQNISDKQINKQLLRGYTARLTFDDINSKMKDLCKIVEKAKIYSASSSPILIEAVSGPELEMITQGIHNYSSRKNAPFIAINLAGMSEEQQDKVLFGTYEEGKNITGALENAKSGTLVIKSIDKLTLQNQYKLISCIKSRYFSKNNSAEDIILIDARIIACSAKDLTKLREQFLFRSDLYFTLRSLRLRIPNLKYRKLDVEFLLDNYIHKYMSQYSKYHVVTAGAKRVLLEYPWQGNSIQLDSFCERLILTSDKRNITEGYVRELLDELYHTDGSIYRVETEEDKNQKVNLQEEEKEDIDHNYDILLKTLKKYEGNRTLTAKELKISTTTLWRKIKKYGLDEKF